MNLGRWEIDDFLTFVCNTHDPETGEATDADSVPTYRIYEDETATPILTGSMALLDSVNTAGFYSERIQMTAANGFEAGKSYNIYISATVSSTEGTMSHFLQVVSGSGPTAAEIADAVWDEVASGHVTAGTFGDKLANKVPSAAIADYRADVSALSSQASVDTIDANVDAILVDTGTTLPATLSTIEGKIDTVDLNVDAIKAVTDLLPDGGALTTIDSNVDAILVDTGTTLPAQISALNDLSAADAADAVWDELASGHITAGSFGDKLQNKVPSATINDYKADVSALALEATVAALNDLSSTDIQTVIENNDLDHLLKIAHPTGVPVASTILDLVMNKDVSQTFDRSTDSLEALRDENYEGPTLQQIIDGVWDELVSAHTGAGSFGEKNQIAVPSATLNDYKADVSALATSAALATVDANVDAILIDTGTTIPATLATLATSAALGVVDTNVDAILVDTGTSIPALIAALNDLSSADIQTVIETNDLDHLAKVAHPTGDPVANTLFDYIMNVDGSQTFDRTTDALEALGSGGGGATPAQIADAVWDEAIAGHVAAGSFGAKNQNLVPSETIGDYKADVSALATAAALATVDANVDAIKAVTDLLPDGGALTTIDANIDAILEDTSITLPTEHAAQVSAILAPIAVIDGNVDAILVDTGTSLPAQITGLEGDIADMQDDVDDILVDTGLILLDTADILSDTALILAAVGGGPPAGAITFIYNVTNTISGNPIGDADVWVTTDEAGLNVIASGKTDQFGNVTFYLDAGTVYMWRQKSGFNFENPDTEVVS